MKKEVLFLGLVFAVLFIAGCQEYVGVNPNYEPDNQCDSDPCSDPSCPGYDNSRCESDEDFVSNYCYQYPDDPNCQADSTYGFADSNLELPEMVVTAERDTDTFLEDVADFAARISSGAREFDVGERDYEINEGAELADAGGEGVIKPSEVFSILDDKRPDAVFIGSMVRSPFTSHFSKIKLLLPLSKFFENQEGKFVYVTNGRDLKFGKWSNEMEVAIAIMPVSLPTPRDSLGRFFEKAKFEFIEENYKLMEEHYKNNPTTPFERNILHHVFFDEAIYKSEASREQIRLALDDYGISKDNVIFYTVGDDSKIKVVDIDSYGDK